MATSGLKKSRDSGKQASVKFAERTTSGRVVSLTREEDVDIAGDPSSSQNNDMNYTVVMPPTPDNNPEGPGSKARHRTESQRPRHGDHFEGEHSSERDDRVSSMRNNNKSMLLRTQTNDFDHNRWLFETKGKYGMGNAYWKQDDSYENEAGVSRQDFMDRPWKPLTRKVKISGAVLSPYRVLMCVRLVALCFYLGWRIQNPNHEAMWLWALSIVCEVWFAISWLLDTLPKFNPINRSADLEELKEKFETPSAANPKGLSDLPGIDVFVSTADPEKEPPLVTANTILSILAVDYPVEKLSLYISDDGGAILTFEAMAETVNFAEVWVPFCRKHNIEPRNPDSYFSKKIHPRKQNKHPDFVKDRRWIKREYDEFKVKVNGLPDVIEKRCKKYNKRQNLKSPSKERNEGQPTEDPSVCEATWMADGTHWPGVWYTTTEEHKKGDHPGIVQIMSKVPEMEPVMGHADKTKLDFTVVDIRLPMFAYVSREKRPGYDHNKKAGAMNALVRASAILSNGAFILNVNCDHYVYNSLAFREGICYMLDRGGDRVCYVQFPQRFEGIDPSDRYANHNTVFFDGNMRALDGLQGPVYVGSGCMFRRYALYGFHPPRINEYKGTFGQKKVKSQRAMIQPGIDDDAQPLTEHPDFVVPQRFGNSTIINESIEVAEFQGRPLADHFSVKNGRPPGSLLGPRQPLDAPTVAEAIAVISCWYEDKTEWGDRIGWIYGSGTEDVVTGYRMHNRGWRSVYCVTKRDAFRGSARINLTDRLHQVLIWASGSVEIFFSKNNALLATTRLKFLQRIAYLNLAIYPFTSIFLVVYLFLPALCLFSGEFIVEGMDIWFLSFLLLMTISLMLISLLEVRWSGVGLEEFWRNEQFWVIGGSSAHFAAVLRGLLKVITGIEISFTVTSKPDAEDDDDDIYADLYVVKWTGLFIVPLTIIIVNLIALVIGVSRTIYSVIPEWKNLFCSCLFSLWVLAHMYPFAKGLMGRRGRVSTIVYVWAGLVSITVSLLWITLTRPDTVAMPGSDDR